MEELKKLKEYPGETYNELIQRLIQLAISAKIRNKCEEDIYKLQHAKMRELWNNEYDEEWEDAEGE